jgi:hypothetical protein
MERAGEKGFSDYCPAEKACIFAAIRYCKKCTEKSNAGKKGRKGLISKINATNFCQRKLF